MTRPHPGSGIGSNLVSFAGAVWLASRLGRDVVVDWRATAFLKDKTLNYFTEFFDTPRTIQGVRVWYAPEVIGEIDSDVQTQLAGIADAHDILRRGSSPARYVIIRSFHSVDRLDPHGDPAEHFWMLHDFYGHIRPRDFVAEEIDRFAREHFERAFIVGVNISTGNGEFAKGERFAGRVDLGVFADERKFLRQIDRARRLAGRGVLRFLRNRTRVFFATDSYAMHDVLAKIPTAVTRRTIFPPPGIGRVFCDYEQFGHSDRAGAIDTLVDMFLLARCNALVRNGSAFSHYAWTVTNCFSGNVRTLDSLYARYWIRAAVNHVRRSLAGR